MVETGTETLSFIVILEKSHLFRKDYAINLGKRKFWGNFARTFSGCSSVRFRVRVWGAWGRKFESSHPDSENKRFQPLEPLFGFQATSISGNLYSLSNSNA